METKWENGQYYVYDKLHFIWINKTKLLTLPDLERAVIDNNLTVYQALTLAYLLGKNTSNG